MKIKYDDVSEFVTKDGSIIRELMHPDLGSNADIGVRNQSLAEATVPVDTSTVLHKHSLTEELYHITSGKGLMTLGEEKFTVVTGDTVCISPGTAHCIKNTGSSDLKIMCCCSPAYSHEDTELLS